MKPYSEGKLSFKKVSFSKFYLKPSLKHVPHMM